MLLRARPLNALLLSDGKPGHYHQAEGVIAALAPAGAGHHHPPRGAPPLRHPDAHAAAARQCRRACRPAILRLGYGLRAAELPPADVVVSAGGETLAANAAAAKALGAANIFCGRLRRLAPEHVMLVLVTLEQPGRASQPPRLPAAVAHRLRPPARATAGGRRFGRDHPPARVGVLIGGNSGAFRYRPEDWLQLTGFLREAHRAHGIRWLATTSRRSGAFIGDALAAMAAEADSGLETFIDFRTAGPGHARPDFRRRRCHPVHRRLHQHALGGRSAPACPWWRWHPRRARWRRARPSIASCSPSGAGIARCASPQLTPAAFLAALEEIAPRTTSARDELAAAIGQRLPMLFGRSGRGSDPSPRGID